MIGLFHLRGCGYGCLAVEAVGDARGEGGVAKDLCIKGGSWGVEGKEELRGEREGEGRERTFTPDDAIVEKKGVEE